MCECGSAATSSSSSREVFLSQPLCFHTLRELLLAAVFVRAPARFLLCGIMGSVATAAAAVAGFNIANCLGKRPRIRAAEGVIPIYYCVYYYCVQAPLTPPPRPITYVRKRVPHANIDVLMGQCRLLLFSYMWKTAVKSPVSFSPFAAAGSFRSH